MKGVGLYCTRNNPSLIDFNDWYKSRDYYGWASQLAKKHCKKYPDVDKDIVYMAASEAAEFYERGGVRTGARFEIVVWVKIRTALFQQKKLHKEDNMVDEKTKMALIEGAKKGITSGELAIKYRMTAKAVQYHLTKARKDGLLPTSKKHEGEARVDPAPFIENPTEPKYDEHELEFEKKIEELAAKNDARPRPLPKPDDDFAVGSAPAKALVTSVWESLIDTLSDTICGMFGTGTVTTEKSYSDIRSKAKATIRTADGTSYKIKIEEV